MFSDKHTNLRYSAFILVFISFGLMTACLLTDNWIIFLDRRTLKPLFWQGLWKRCIKNLKTSQVKCDDLPANEVKVIDRAVRYLISISIGSSGMILITSLVMKVMNRIYMDVLSLLLLGTTIALLTGISCFVDTHTSLGKAGNYYGYSLALGVIAVVCLFTANVFTVITRLERK